MVRVRSDASALATPFGTHLRSCAALVMRSRSSDETRLGVFRARDTDAVDTPARRATSSSFTAAPFARRGRRDLASTSTRSPLITLSSWSRSNGDHDVILLDADGHRLCLEWSLRQLFTWLHLHGQGPPLNAVGIAPGLPGADVELPAVPGATQHFPLACQAVLTGSR